MRGVVMILVGLVLAAFAVVVGAEEPAEVKQKELTWTEAALPDVETLYVRLCAVCHGWDGKGEGPAAAALKDPVPDLTVLARENSGVYPADEVRRSISGERAIIAHGTPEMPVWSHTFEDVRPDVKPVRRWAFARQRIDDLVGYLETLQAP